MKRITIVFLTVLTVNVCIGQQPGVEYYLPAGIEYNSAVLKPSEVLGFEVGEWHVGHDKLVNYMKKLAGTSDRVTFQQIGKTYEDRPLVNLIITSPENHKNLESIRQQHVQLTNPETSGDLDISNMPAVAYLGYSVHGNEASGSNASLLVAYYLAAAQGNEINELLEDTIIILDPSFNPDGLNRFASWVNSRKSIVENSDGYNMEQNEPWPRGRTNHYWFDVNRDWLPVQLPESQARIAVFHKWKPNLLTDHHEMGTNSTFFFQPGIPSRNNPLTPENTYTLTRRLGEYHAKALDKIGSLYYTNESYDDYYYGKGSTYPDVNGAVGILFEQASSRGHAQESVNGVLRFPFTIRNHVTTSLSSLKGLKEMREDFLTHQRDFFRQTIQEAAKDSYKAYVFASNDKTRAFKLAELVDQHDIDIYKSGKPLNINGHHYARGDAYVIPLQQPQYRLIKAMFERRTTFKDSLFYDVSSWTFPLAFNVDYNFISSTNGLLAEPYNKDEPLAGRVIGGESDYAYVFRWDDYFAPKALFQLLKKGYLVKVASSSFHGLENQVFKPGSIIIPVGPQSSTDIFDDLQEIANTCFINMYAQHSGLDYQGASLGSPSFDNVTLPKVMMLVDGGVSSYESGEVWHLFDQRYEMNISLIPIDIFNRADINKYNTLIMVNGRYGDISDPAKEKIKGWVRNGGTIVATKSALTYLNTLGIGKFDMKKSDSPKSPKNKNYDDIGPFYGAQEIGGAIFQVKVDLGNPLLYGYDNKTLAVFRNSEMFMKQSDNPFANPVTYSANPLLSGYISEENLGLLKNSSAVGVCTYGRGKIIGFTDNPNFRAFWYGTNKMFMNAIFFGPLLNRRSAR